MSNITRPYTATNWYWVKANGNVFSSAKQAFVKANDPDFATWSEAGGIATPWPKDQNGDESDAAMTDVLSPYGMSLPKTTKA